MFDQQQNPIVDGWKIAWRGSQKFRYRLYSDLLKDILPTKKKITILDIGCALGNFTKKVWQLDPKNEILGIDISENAIARVSKMFPNMKFKQAFLPTLPFNKHTFDLVLCLEVLYYLNDEDRERSVQAIKRILKDGGHLFLSVVLDGGKRYFSEEDIIRLLSKYFSLESVRFNYAKPYTWVEKRLLFLYSMLAAMQGLSSMADEEFQYFINEKSAAKVGILLKVRSILAMPILGLVLKLLLECGRRGVKGILSIECIPAAFYRFAKIFAKNTSKSQIMILAKYQEEE